MTNRPKAPESYLPLRSNWFHILLALADGGRHGYAIMGDVAQRTSGKVRLWPATLYGTLRQMEEEGLLEETPEESSPDQRRRYYRLTQLGRHVLQAEARRLQELVDFLRTTRVGRSSQL